MTVGNPIGDRVSNLALNGTPIDPAGHLPGVDQQLPGRGWGRLHRLHPGHRPQGGPIDLDALVDYFAANSPVAPPPLNRITLA